MAYESYCTTCRNRASLFFRMMAVSDNRQEERRERYGRADLHADLDRLLEANYQLAHRKPMTWRDYLAIDLGWKGKP